MQPLLAGQRPGVLLPCFDSILRKYIFFRDSQKRRYSAYQELMFAVQESSTRCKCNFVIKICILCHAAIIAINTVISRKVVGKNVHATIPKGNMGYAQYTVSDDCSSRTYFCCFPLALANICPWTPVPFFQISLKNSALKTTHNTFRDCRVYFFRQPFSKQLYIQYCAKEMQTKFSEISKITRISAIKLRTFVSDKKGASIDYCRRNFASKVIINQSEISRREAKFGCEISFR